MYLDHNEKLKGQVVLVDANIHKKAKLTKEKFLEKVSFIKYLRTHVNYYYISFYITDIEENNNLIKFHDLVNKGIFDFDYYHVFAISVQPKLYNWFKTHDLLTIQKQITAWLAASYFFNVEKREIQERQIYKPLFEEVLTVVEKYYKDFKLPDLKLLNERFFKYGDETILAEEEKCMKKYAEVCKEYAKVLPPEFLKSPFDFEIIEDWGVNQHYNFEFVQAYLTDRDWERIIKGNSEDDMHRAESRDDLWEKWKHVYTTYDRRKNFVYSFYFQPDEERKIESKNKRKPIPPRVKNQVWNRDGGVCVECGNNEKLEFDHIIPISKGGSSTYRNVQLLCESCNRRKSDKI